MSPAPSPDSPASRQALSRRAFLAAAGAAGVSTLAARNALTPGASASGPTAAGTGPVATAVPAGKKITLVVADADDTTMTPGLIAAFRAQHPDITIERHYTGWDDYLKSINTTMSADSAPDIAQ